mmetsp:Transcript_20466/g.33926  ORF Transcript_20466/g.33926 Transcript_20466/m.33926 type:complete len:203 (+) Transcript_20466:3926-4534(+)
MMQHDISISQFIRQITPRPIFRPFAWPLGAPTKYGVVLPILFLKGAGDGNGGPGARVNVPSSIWFALLANAALGCDAFTEQSFQFINLPLVDTDRVLHNTPMIRILVRVIRQGSIARWDGLRTMITMIVFRTRVNKELVIVKWQMLLFVKVSSRLCFNEFSKFFLCLISRALVKALHADALSLFCCLVESLLHGSPFVVTSI